MLNLTVDQQLPVISTNFDMVKAELTESIKKYKGMIVTEETLKSCKSDQGDLASARIKIDKYRLEVKKEISKPITEFENNCKILIALVEDAEKPLKEGIAVFDQKKKDANRKIAEDIITNAIAEHGLNAKYAVELIVLEKYCNLTSKPTDVKNDVEQRLFLLLQEQQQEEECIQIMKDTIENVNKGIDAKLSLEDFQSLLDMKASPVKVMQEINTRAERIKANEEKAVADKAARAEKEVQERIAKAEREAAEKVRVEERNIRIAKEKAEEVERLRLKAIEMAEKEIIFRAEAKKEGEERAKLKLEQESKLREISRNIDLNPATEKMYFIEMRVEGTLQEIKDLSQFLRDNNYNYVATNKGEI